jgi:fructokinase
MMRAGIELGGTKTVVAVADGDGTVAEEIRYSTGTPEETLGRAVEWIRERGAPAAIGIAAFGPVAINRRHVEYGHMLATPKPGWKGADLLGPFATAFPAAAVALDTDVNAAALAEAREGAVTGMDDVAYITIGTGIGAGILAGGRLVHGVLHPEFGHFKPPRAPGDDSFPGVCPFHGDCLEGMASGPAIARRWGRAASELPAEHQAWDFQAWYLAHAVLVLTAVVSPQRVIIGGGVSQAAGLHDKVEAILHQLAAGYFPQIDGAGGYVVPPALGQQAGIRGALLLEADAG